MSRSVITPNLSENHLVLGTSGKSRKNKIVPLNEFSFDLLPQKWLSISDERTGQRRKEYARGSSFFGPGRCSRK